MHNGTLISDLQSLVTKFGSTGHLGDGAAERSGDSPNGSKSPLLPIQSSPDLSSASPSAGEGYLDRICNNCGQPHGKHSHIDDACPEPYLVGPMYSTTEFFDSGKRCDMCGQAEEDHGNGWRCL